ncbi:TauD/TfdA family dioxygenase [Synechococcus sp. AH-551-A10]|nr:TauD/TfdA family dioxygenase [Synechococcus sp. AH-551-A10]MDB4682076.1 TauD/TfdA family dioxygenase [Synechococcus sp. AH-551-A10]
MTILSKQNIVATIDGSQGINSIAAYIKKNGNHTYAFDVINVNLSDYVQFYKELASKLGKIKEAHPVNDKTKKFGISRDIRPIKGLYHYYASNTRQPLHSDYAYYPQNKAPNWLMLYCLKPSKYGGLTHLLSTKTLREILQDFNPSLLEKLYNSVTWFYTGIDGDCIHQRHILKDDLINWNFWQIKQEYNSPETLKIRDEFFDFLENVIVAGNIYDFSKKWEIGNAVIFNDQKFLHGRDAFLGDRWLKDHAFFML